MTLADAVSSAPRRKLTGKFWHQGSTRHPLVSCTASRNPTTFQSSAEVNVDRRELGEWRWAAIAPAGSSVGGLSRLIRASDIIPRIWMAALTPTVAAGTSPPFSLNVTWRERPSARRTVRRGRRLEYQ